MEPVVLNRERAAADRLKRMPMLFDDYRDEDFYGLPRKYGIVARVEVKFPIEPRYRDRQHFILSDINGAKIEAITSWYETVKHFNNLLHEKHVYKMHNVKFGLHPGEFNLRHLNGPMELYLNQQTIVEPYIVPIQMAPFPKTYVLEPCRYCRVAKQDFSRHYGYCSPLGYNSMHNVGPIQKDCYNGCYSASSLRIIPQYTSICSITTPIILDGFFMENGEPTETDQMEHNDGRTPLTNISNTITIVSLSDGCSTIDFTNFATQGIADGDEKVNVNQDDDSDWLHRNETFKADDVFTTRDLLTPDAIEPDGSAVTPYDWVIPEIPSNPFLPASTQTEDVDSLHMSTGPLRPSISRNMATAIENTISDAGEGDDWTQPHMTAKINNNVDDDDGVVFEDDADENEGYLFAGQYEDTDEDIEIDGSQDESTATDVPDPYDKVYSNIPEETHMLKIVPNCGYCTAKKFEYEPHGFFVVVGRLS
ncbi:hypothetical protein Zm00014a_000276 [Zea mays]|uniref:Uncharacterized protein n=1 Tax=Zea mays TaxID=4577 RepID=A0A3L6DM72_MAIZE|nr:hypothetical protein Zm00014a_000276 [Zea mays]